MKALYNNFLTEYYMFDIEYTHTKKVNIAVYVHTILLTDSNKHCWTIINLKGFTFKKHIAGNWKIKHIAYFGRTVLV